jgi:DMSO/TMAO reductase YedYZ molybdopterin-dependent catalytic subunit
MSNPPLDRRALLKRTAAAAGASLLAGCDRLSNARWFRRTLETGEDANLFVQRLLLSPAKLAPEYSEAEISPWFKPNGSTDPSDKSYKAMVKNNFADWNLEIGGLVDNPAKFSLADLRAMPARTQITRHDCVEGWTCIGKWTGVPLSELLKQAGLKPQARYIVFHCADIMEGAGAADDDDDEENKPEGRSASNAESSSGDSAGSGTKPVYYYESIDLEDAFHAQTILAYEMNGAPLPIQHGAPLRLRLERALGYKMAKYVMRIQVVDDYKRFGNGKGGYWEDRGYDWYAGI